MTSRPAADDRWSPAGPLDAYVELSPDAVLAVDDRGRVRAANTLAGEMFGYGPAELTGLSLEELVPGRFRAAHTAHREGYRQAPKYRRMGAGLDLWGLRKDGSEFPIDVSLAPLRGPEGNVVVAAVRDITQRRREQAAQAQLTAIVTSETRCLRRDGSELFAEATLSAVCGRPGRPAGIAVVLRDLTERRLAGQEATRARRREEQLLVMSDRERIARDLHDRVIQRIFAAGLSLQGTAAIAGPAAAGRIRGVIDELDITITEIRHTIFGLEHARRPPGGLRAGVLDLAARAAGQLGHQPSVELHGPIDTTVGSEVACHLLAVAREALANVARHAHAHATHIELAAGDDVVLRVTDDGVGTSGTTRGCGLANLRQRARALGGSLAISRPHDGGTRLEWRVPLHPG